MPSKIAVGLLFDEENFCELVGFGVSDVADAMVREARRYSVPIVEDDSAVAELLDRFSAVRRESVPSYSQRIRF